MSKQVLTLVITAIVAILQSPSPTRACTCPDAPMAVARWPKDGASSVAIDTPIVIATSKISLSVDQIVLTSADGERISVSETLRLAPSWDGCGKLETVFVRAADTLRTGTSYTVSFQAPKLDKTLTSTFSVGEQAFATEEPINPEVYDLSVFTSPSCVTSDCSDLAEIEVDLGQSPELPRWLVVESRSSSNGKNDWSFWPDGFFQTPAADPTSNRIVQLGVALPPDDKCVDVRIYGVEGRALCDERRCAPDRCAVYGIRGASDCGRPESSGVEARRLPEGSCESPPLLTNDTGVLRVPGEDAGIESMSDAGVATNDHHVSPMASCSATGGAGTSDATFLAASWLLLARRRSARRSRLTD